MDEYIVYIRIDERNRIIEVNSSAFLDNTTGWIEIDSGTGDKYHHAQGNYFEKSIFEDHGIPVYKFEEGKVVERTQSEIDADIADIPEPEISDTDLLLEMAADHEFRISELELFGGM